MGDYDTSELHRRQDSSDVGHTVGNSTTGSTSRRRRGFLVPLGVLALGILLAMWGPLPGLGLMLTLGGAMGLVITVGLLLTDGFS